MPAPTDSQLFDLGDLALQGGATLRGAQLAYKTDPGLNLVELAVVGHNQLVSMERTFVAGFGNTIRVFSVSTQHAPDVSKRESIATAPATDFVQKNETLRDLNQEHRQHLSLDYGALSGLLFDVGVFALEPVDLQS